MRLPIHAAFYFALLAGREQYVRLDDARTAAVYPYMEKRDRSELDGRVTFALSGPGRVPRYEELLTPAEREAAVEATRERDEAWEKLKEAGLLQPIGFGPSSFLKVKDGSDTDARDGG